MELLKISDAALKVSLSREDMEYYDIEFDTLDYSNARTRRVIWSILDEAKRTLGFETVRENLYIRAFRCMSGGCELFVSRSEGGGAENVLYRFENAAFLINACARLANCGFDGESRLFCGDDGWFYLVICAKRDFVFLDEVGARLKFSEPFLSEHTYHICDRAVEKMAELK